MPSFRIISACICQRGFFEPVGVWACVSARHYKYKIVRNELQIDRKASNSRMACMQIWLLDAFKIAIASGAHKLVWLCRMCISIFRLVIDFDFDSAVFGSACSRFIAINWAAFTIANRL